LTHYHVDLRSFSIDERKRLYDLLDGFSFMCNPFVDQGRIGVYDVFWESSEPIEKALRISPKFVIPQS